MDITPSSGNSIPTFKLLDDIVTSLGALQLGFWPGLSTRGDRIHPYGASNDITAALAFNEQVAEELQDDFDPIQHIGGIVSYYLNSSDTNNFQVPSEGDLSFQGSNGMSMGLWIQMTEPLGTKRTLISKYDATGAAEDRTYTFDIDTSGNLILELFDESANASEIATGTGDVIVPFVWNFVVATYDGTADDPTVKLYRNAVDSNSGQSPLTVESGTFVDMEIGATDFGIGCQVRAASTEQEFEGRIALPFICAKKLSQGNVSTLYSIGQTLLGLA